MKNNRPSGTFFLHQFFSGLEEGRKQLAMALTLILGHSLKYSLVILIILSVFRSSYLSQKHTDRSLQHKDFAIFKTEQFQDLVAEQQMLNIDTKKAMVYGPGANVSMGEHYDLNGYSFLKVPRIFNKKIDLDRSREMTRSEFENLILTSIPKKLADRLEKYLPVTLAYAEKYQVDPFWVVSIMWTESHFNPAASSYLKASGLMQIMPETTKFLANKLHRAKISNKMALDLARIPLINIEMGIYYLDKLIKMFNYDYKLATIAYNMGPYAVKAKITKSERIGDDHNYLNKVTSAYKFLTEVYVKQLHKTRPRYEETFVFALKKGDAPKWEAFFSTCWELNLDPEIHRKISSLPLYAKNIRPVAITPTAPIIL